jgi:ABC-type multidrug transport system fused ATPase/permease subunit
MSVFSLKSKHLKDLISVLRQNRSEFVLVLVFMALSSGAIMLVPYWAKVLVNEIMLKKDFAALLQHLLWGLLLFLAILFFEFERELRKFRLGNSVEAAVRVRLFRKIIGMPLNIIPEQRTGDLISRISSDVRIFGGGIQSGLLTLIPNLLITLGLMAMMLWYSLPLSIVTVILISPMAWAVQFFMRRIRSKARIAQEKLGVVNNMVDESLRGIKEIKCYGREELVGARFIELNNGALEAHNQQDKLRAFNPAIVSCQTFITIGVMILVCSWMLKRGLLPVESLTAFVTCLLLVFTPITRISGAFGFMGKTFAAMDRFDEILSLPAEPLKSEKLPQLPEIKGHIRFENVCFRYHRNGFHLTDLNFQIEPGETLAIVGPSGAGKTTLINLLLRFLDPFSGTILMDGHDIYRFRIDSLRKQIGFVPQDPVLFDATLGENLYFVKENATEKEIRAAARAAHVDQFARDFPMGYDSPIGQYGSRLSVGQRQRIAIARAFLLNPRLLILDEPTSALDPESEHLINESLQRLREGRTTIIVAHRMSTIRNANRIMVLDNGRVVQLDTRQNLLRETGLFRRLSAYGTS